MLDGTVSVQEVVLAVVGFGLLLKTIVEMASRRNGAFRAADRQRLAEIWEIICGPRGTDPHDGSPRCYSSDKLRDVLSLLRRIDNRCSTCIAAHRGQQDIGG